MTTAARLAAAIEWIDAKRKELNTMIRDARDWREDDIVWECKREREALSRVRRVLTQGKKGRKK